MQHCCGPTRSRFHLHFHWNFLEIFLVIYQKDSLACILHSRDGGVRKHMKEILIEEALGMLLELVQLVENMMGTPLAQAQKVGYRLGMLHEQVQDMASGHELEMLGQQ